MEGRFERHSRLIYLTLILAAFAICLLVVESLPLFPEDPLLAGTPMASTGELPAQAGQSPVLLQRVIRLKEHRPNSGLDAIPPDSYLAGTDSLQRKVYPFWIDADGFVMPSAVHPDPDVKIVFLGGSTTECLYVSPEKRFPFLTGRLLERSTSLRINSYNGGVSGDHTMHLNLILLAKILPIRPDVVVLMEAVNDYGSQLLLGGYWNDHPQRSLIVRETTAIQSSPLPPPTEPMTRLRALKSLVYALIPNTYTAGKRVWDKVTHAAKDVASEKITVGSVRAEKQSDEFAAQRGHKITPDLPAMLAAFRSSLVTFVEITRAWGSQPVLMTQATRLTRTPDPLARRLGGELEASNGITYDDNVRMYEAFNETIREVAHDLNVPLIDLHRSIPATSTYIYDAVHFNDHGSEQAAQIIARELRPIVATVRRGAPVAPPSGGGS